MTFIYLRSRNDKFYLVILVIRMGKSPLSNHGTQLTLGKTPSLEFNVVKLIIWMVESTILFTFHQKFKVL